MASEWPVGTRKLVVENAGQVIATVEYAGVAELADA